MLCYACQLLNNQPRLVSGTMMNQHHRHLEHGFHGQKEVARYFELQYKALNGQLFFCVFHWKYRDTGELPLKNDDF